MGIWWVRKDCWIVEIGQVRSPSAASQSYTIHRGPNAHINIRILHSGTKAQHNKGDSRNISGIPLIMLGLKI